MNHVSVLAAIVLDPGSSKALTVTVTVLALIASAALAGLSKLPNDGHSMPVVFVGCHARTCLLVVAGQGSGCLSGPSTGPPIASMPPM